MVKEVVKVEVRFAVHLPKNSERDDYHYVKELHTYSDGSTEVKIRLIKDYLRPVYVTKENARDHIEKKEYESLDNLICQMTTDSDMYQVAANMLGTPHLGGRKNLLNQSPYLYGTDITASSLIKLESLRRNNFVQSPYTYAMFDVETNPHNDELRVASIVREVNGEYEIYAVVDSDWVKEFKDVRSLIVKDFQKQYPEEFAKSKLTINVCDHQLDMIRNVFLTANKWSPDFVGIWNMEFDLHKIILNILKRYNASPLDYICDQRVPRELRRFDFIPAPDVFVTAGGVHVSKQPADKWHKCYSTTTFHFIDTMCTFRALRLHKPREYSYALDYILRKYNNTHKLEIEEAEKFSGLKWHLWMQENRKITYISYNFGDNIEPVKLDKVTKDLETSLPVFAEATDFNDFGSSNKKAYCSLYEFCLQKGYILGVGADMSPVYKKYADDPNNPEAETYRHDTFSTRDWIQTIPQDNMLPVGMTPFSDYRFVVTSTYGATADIDSVSSYPSCTIAGNVSRTTNVSAVCWIGKYDEFTAKELCLGLIVGNTNTLEICSRSFNLPSMEEISNMCLTGEINNY